MLTTSLYMPCILPHPPPVPTEFGALTANRFRLPALILLADSSSEHIPQIHKIV
jgi:hypothetical protein